MSKLLMIGLDSAEASLIRKWASEGCLPSLRALLEQGVMADLGSPAKEFPDLVWPTIYSGLGPARIGRYYYIQLQPEDWSLRLLEDELRPTPFWVQASQYGKRSIIVDVPKIALGPEFNGMQLASWGAHASHAESASHPPELLAQVLARYGPYPLHSCDSHGRRPRDYARLRDQMLAGVDVRGRLFLDLLTASEWDLFFCAFSETHCAGHQFWHLYDAGHPEHDPQNRLGLKNALRDVYEAVDRAIGAMVEAAGPGTQVLLFSGHGMRPQYHGRDLIPSLLKMWGMLGEANIPPDPAAEQELRVHRSLLKRIRDKIPMPWQYAVKSLLPKPIERYLVCKFMGVEKLNPSARAVYVPNNDLNTSIRVNLIGRDKYGRVSAGREYDELCGFLAARFSELINPATGRPAAEKITRVSKQFSGEYRDVLPDLTVLWSPEHSIDALYSPGYGTVIGSHHDLRTGGHAPGGFLVVPQSVAAVADLSQPHDKDIGPTALQLLGVPVPATMEGRSLLQTPASRTVGL